MQLPSPLRPRHALFGGLLLLFGPLVALACGASAADSAGTSSGLPPHPSDDSGIPPADVAPVDTAPPPPPPEREVESSYRSPVATGRYVWVANPTSGRVALIDAKTLEVQVVEAGNGPTYLAAVPTPDGADVAVVLNVASDDATLLRVTDKGIENVTFATAHGMNTWSVSPDGHWAIAWTDAVNVARKDSTEGFQDLTVIDLTRKVPPTVLAVGYRPVLVGFTSDGVRAYAVTQDGVSIVDLSGASPLVTRNVPIADDPLTDPGTRDVAVTPDGSLALVRRDKSADITVVDLVSGAHATVTLSGPVTDLDLAADGSKAVAVVRDNSEVAILPLPGIATAPTSFSTLKIGTETVGSVSIAKSSGEALLYTNAVAIEHLTVLDLGATPSFHVLRLYAPVLAAFPTDDGKNAIILHDLPKVGSTKAGAFSVVPVGAGLPAKIVGTDAPLTSVALASTGDRALVTERDDVKKIYGVHLVHMPTLEINHYSLASPPLAAGIIGASNRGWIAQQHPEGRITFVDLDKGGARTITGFELGARVVDGSKP